MSSADRFIPYCREQISATDSRMDRFIDSSVSRVASSMGQESQIKPQNAIMIV